MWLTKREWVRHQRELRAALERATRAESALIDERKSKDALIVELTSRVVTHNGGYGLRAAEPAPIPAPPHPQRFIRDPTDDDYAKRDWYRAQCQKNGYTEEEADRYWEAEMRGEHPALIGGEQ